MTEFAGCAARGGESTAMEKTALATMEKHGLLSPGDKVIVALSGGADSVALFHFLTKISGEFPLDVLAAQFEHGLRGMESEEDMDFVRALCAEHGVPFYAGCGQMSTREKPKGKSVEMWARDERYAFLKALAEEHDAKIAVAHTLNDNAETILFNAARGTGVRGLAGIPPARGRVVRPLLEVSRAQVEEYCLANGLGWRVDSTNFDARYSRNKIRHTALPALEEAHPGAARSLCRTAEDMRALDGWLSKLAAELLENAAALGGSTRTAGPAEARFNAAALRAAPQPVRLAALAALAGRKADRAALAQLEQVLAKQAKAAQLPGGRRAYLLRGALVVDAGHTATDLQEKEDAGFEEPVQPGRFTFPGGFCASVEIAAWPDETLYNKIITGKDLTFAADCDKIIDRGIFRTRKKGDRFAPAGRGVVKTLKKLMNENGTGHAQRAYLPLIAERGTGRVLFLWNEGFCEGMQPTETTNSVLVITQEQQNTEADEAVEKGRRGDETAN